MILIYENLKDVFFNSKFHVGKGMATYDNNLSKATFNMLPDMQSIVDSQIAAKEIINSEITMNAIAGSKIAMDKIINSETAVGVLVKSNLAIGKLVAGLAELDSRNYVDMDAVASDEAAMNQIINSEIAMKVLVKSSLGIGKIAVGLAGLDPKSYSDMNEVAGDEVALSAIVGNETAVNVVGKSNLAVGKLAVGLVGLDPKDYPDTYTVANCEIAMNAIAADTTARNVVQNSEVAMDIIGQSNLAIGKLVVGLAGLNPGDYSNMSEVANNGVAMDEIANKSVAIRVIAASELAMNIVATSQVAMNAIVKYNVAVNAILTPSLPHTFSNARAIYDSASSSGMIDITRRSAETVIFNGIALKQRLGFTDKNTMKIYVSADTLGDTSSRMKAIVRIGDAIVLDLSGINGSFVQRTLNVSGITGRQTVEFGYSSSYSGENEEYKVRHGRFFLE